MQQIKPLHHSPQALRLGPSQHQPPQSPHSLQTHQNNYNQLNQDDAGCTAQLLQVSTSEPAVKIKSRWTRSFFTDLNWRDNQEKYICDICQKQLTCPSNLALHRNTHVIERPYKCEPCGVSFNTMGHLQKHKRSSAHETRVKMTEAFGVPTKDNPRPYGCQECDVAFRKHGHLSKHLRSKSHILKMEASGFIPAGTYALFEKSGPEIKEQLKTKDCEQSLQSLRTIAMALIPTQTVDMLVTSSSS